MKEKINSFKCLCSLSRKLYKENRRRNIAIVIAIIMATTFVMTVFAVTESIEEMMLLQNLKQMGTVAEGMYYSVTLEQYENLRKSESFNDISYDITLGKAEISGIGAKRIQLVYSEDKATEWAFGKLKEGEWPQKENELVISERYLEETGRDYDIGDTIQISLVNDALALNHEFVISGICSDNKMREEINLYVSKAFLEQVYYEKVPESLLAKYGIRYGLRTVYCRFEYSQGAEAFLKSVWTQANGEEEYSVMQNFGYGTGESDFMSQVFVWILIGVVILGAYVTIYTIYYISVVRDVKMYGQLKLIGVTIRQISVLVWMQAIKQYFIGMPIGLIVGSLVGFIVLPFMVINQSNNQEIVYRITPEFLLYAALITFFIILISVNKPVKLISKIPPIHTTGFTGVGKIRKKNGKSGKVTIHRMAMKNVLRNKRRSALVSLSVVVVMVLFVCTSTLVNSVSLEGFMAVRQLPADFVVGSNDFLIGDLVHVAEDREGLPFERDVSIAMDNNVLEEIQSLIPEAVIEPYYYLSNLHLNNFESTKKLQKLFDEGKINNSAYYYKNIADLEENEALLWCAEQRYYVSYETLEKCTMLEGTLNREQFESGKYAVVIRPFGIAENESVYHVGEKIALSDWPNGFGYKKNEDGSGEFIGEEKIEYEVMAVVDEVPLICSYLGDPVIVFLPACRLPQYEEAPQLYAIAINTEETKELEPVIKSYIQRKGGDMDYLSYATIKEELSEASDAIVLVGGGLAFVIAIMALVNFINNCMTSITERREELATLRAIGMTKRQLIQMLRGENLYIVGFSAVLGIVLGAIICNTGVRAVCGEYFWLSYDFSILPAIILVIILIFIATRYPSNKTNI